MRALVLGGCGFIGSHIVDGLLKRGLRVRVFDRSGEKFRSPLPDVEYVSGDFRDGAALVEALTGVDIVVHLVSMTFPGTAAIDPQADVRENILPTLFLLDAMVRLNVPRLLYLSSGGTVYGPPEQIPTAEAHALRPINSYGIVKTAIEHYVEMYRRTHGLETLIIRASNPYGARQGHTGVQGVINTFLRRVLEEEPIEIWGDGAVVRDYIYIEDLAELCVLAAISDVIGIFNGGSGIGLSLKDLVHVIAGVTGRRIEPVFRPGRSIDVPSSILDISKARCQFPWTPRVSLTDGLSKTWNWLNTFHQKSHIVSTC